jgi:hypothetical protein
MSGVLQVPESQNISNSGPPASTIVWSPSQTEDSAEIGPGERRTRKLARGSAF